MYAARFNSLFEQGREAILAGAVQCQVPPVDGGSRWVMSVVLRPDAATARRIEDVTRNAMAVAGAGHWPTGKADSSHFTLRALENHRVSVPDGDARVARYIAALRKATSTVGPVRLTLSGLTLTPGCVMLCAEPGDDAVERLYDAYGDALAEDGWLEAGFDRNIWYSTLLHFTSPLANPQAVVQWVGDRRHLALGEVECRHAELVVYRFNGSRMVMETLDAVPLSHRP
ncbi:2'-5' RNA ligase family protein [Streptomyces sp. NPDC055955]|uniref:2'-5' RNA ligase family protein n=1 Tax=Streptomyces sp. NPDC055955 TaxID=3345665 RepID=UPI0035DCC749